MGWHKSDEETFDIDDVVCIADTAEAVLVKNSDGEQDWFPRSQIRGGDIKRRGDSGTLTITEWLATERGLT